jgi:hypothetical protein
MMPWEGKERRDPETTSGRVTGDVVSHTITGREERKLRRRYRWNVFLDQLFEKRYILAIITMTQFMLLGLMAYGITNTNNKAATGIAETRGVTEFISQFVQTSSQVGAKRNNNVAQGLDCLTQILVTVPEGRTQKQIDECRGYFRDAIVPPPTKEQIDEFLKALKQNGG